MLSKNDRMGKTVLAGLILLLIVGAPRLFLELDGYQAWTAGFQAFGAVAALGYAAVSIAGERRDRHVDRVVDLHLGLISGEVGEARRRLAHHLKELAEIQGHPGEAWMRATTDELEAFGKSTRTYAPPSPFEPTEDAALLGRFFERAHAMLTGGSVDERLFHELIGRHAAWWALALKTEVEQSARWTQALRDLANRTTRYEQQRRARGEPPQSPPWGSSRKRHFGWDTSAPL